MNIKDYPKGFGLVDVVEVNFRSLKDAAAHVVSKFSAENTILRGIVEFDVTHMLNSFNQITTSEAISKNNICSTIAHELMHAFQDWNVFKKAKWLVIVRPL
ncbi:MAG: hypothetical protein ABIE74_03220 [Pseudomonadota bacterium]